MEVEVAQSILPGPGTPLAIGWSGDTICGISSIVFGIVSPVIMPLISDNSLKNTSSNMSGIEAALTFGSTCSEACCANGSLAPVKSVTGGSFEVPNAISNAFVGSRLIGRGFWCSCSGCDAFGVCNVISCLFCSFSPKVLKLMLNSLFEFARMLWKNLTIFFSLQA
ncbi:hypothetical protein OGATHE_000240 [Ogataea polymorpha]|uniref:Uncharacterized protein n=1 Tax=Ogataea polymorpha TaxID=460523 RepID=A0A9P8PW65_9ASCO|nr:hypothetical protein OGATHE_000240 [Ogataea polymorpha]